MDLANDKKKRNTRDIIFHTIKSTPQITVEDLAAAAEVSPVTVRHHLKALQADGLIEVTSIRRKVGRPYFVFSVSEKGQELFPTRYLRLTSRLLDQLKGQFPEELVNQLFDGVVRSVLEQHRGQFEHLDIEARLDYLVSLLADEGFLASWERNADGYTVVEYSCPYLSIGNRHEEVCTFDMSLMRGVLQLPVQQHSCMINGDACCQFSIRRSEPVLSTAI